MKRYALLDSIATDKYGQLHRALDTRMQREVAVRVLDVGFVARRREGLLARLGKVARLNHLHLERVFDYDLDADPPYVVTEFGTGRLLTGRKLPLGDVLHSMAGVADALAILHRNEIVHGRLYPAALLHKAQLNEAEATSVNLMVVGLGMEADDAPERWPYRAPEQWRGEEIDARTDVYALGVLLYELVTGCLPFVGADVRQQHLGRQPIAPLELVDCPPALDALIRGMLAKEPAGRPASMGAVAVSLRQIAQAFEVVTDGEDVDELQLTRGDETVILPLDKRIVLVGKGTHNDVMLDGAGVAATHLRLEHHADGWHIFDLGSRTGTRLDGQQLVAQIGEVWRVGQIVTVGAWELKWQGQDVSEIVLPSVLSSVVVSADSLHLTIPPGESDALTLHIHNDGEQVMHGQITVGGLSADWLTEAAQLVYLLPRDSAEITFTLSPPKTSRSLAGAYPFNLLLATQQESQPRIVGTGVLTVLAFHGWRGALQPQRLRIAGHCVATIENTGNVPLVGRVTARDSADLLHFTTTKSEVEIGAGSAETVGFAIKAKQRGWIGRSERTPFQVFVTNERGERLQLDGSAEITPRFPIWLLSLVIGFLLFSVTTGYFLTTSFNQRRVESTRIIEAAQTRYAVQTTLTAAAQAVERAQTVTIVPTVPTATPISTLTPRP